MNQYTIRNTAGGFGADNVVIRTKDRVVARRFMGPGYSCAVRCLDRARYGLANMECRAAAVVQYALPGFAKDTYMGAN